MTNFPKFVLAFLFLLTACDGALLDSEGDDADDVVDSDSDRVPARPSKSTGNGSSSTASGDTTSDGVGGSDDDGSTSSSSADSSTSSGSGGEGGDDATVSTSVGTGGDGGGEPLSAVIVRLADDTPESRIVLTSNAPWELYEFTRYDVVNNSDEDIIITSVEVDQVHPNGDIADFSAVNVSMDPAPGLSLYSDGWLVSSGVVDPSAHFTEGPLDFNFPNESMIIPSRETITLIIYANMSLVRPGSSVDGAWHDIARSGHSPALEIISLETDAGSAVIEEHEAPSMVLRKNRPIITHLPLPTNTLVNDDVDLMKFQVSADVAGMIAMKKWGIGFGKTGAFSISDLRIRRGASDLPLSSYTVEVATPNGTSSIIEPDMGFGNINIMFTDEQAFAGPGFIYTLHSEATGVESGDVFTVTLGTGLSWDPVTTCVSDIMPNGFVWSDVSEVPHSALSCQQGGSLDWTHETLVPGLGFSETLSL
jgi:hypothetical protein